MKKKRLNMKIVCLMNLDDNNEEDDHDGIQEEITSADRILPLLQIFTKI